MSAILRMTNAFCDRLSFLSKNQVLDLCAKACIPYMESEEQFELSTLHVATLRHILHRRYVFGIYVALLRKFPRDVVLVMGEFFDYSPHYWRDRKDALPPYIRQRYNVIFREDRWQEENMRVQRGEIAEFRLNWVFSASRYIESEANRFHGNWMLGNGYGDFEVMTEEIKQETLASFAEMRTLAAKEIQTHTRYLTQRRNERLSLVDADVAQAAQAARAEKPRARKPRAPKVWKCPDDSAIYYWTHEGVNYFRNAHHHVWLQWGDMVGPWRGIYIPSEDRIDTSAVEPVYKGNRAGKTIDGVYQMTHMWDGANQCWIEIAFAE